LLFATIVALVLKLMVYFPPELVDHFIDSLCDDKSFLQTCGLVCKQWSPRSRSHLFSEVTLQVGQVADQGVPDDMETFLGLVETSSFDILAAVRRLVLTYEAAYEAEDPLAKAHLLRFAHCSQLTHLNIKLPELNDDAMVVSLCSQLAAVGPKLSSLSNFSFSVGGTSLHGLLQILACVPTVETLALYGIDIFMSDSSAPAPLFPQHLRNLLVDVRNGTDVFFEHLLSLPAIPQLRSLEFTAGVERDDDTLLASYLEHAGPALQSLKIWLINAALGKPLLSSRL
jgi:hypothetical protein